MTALSPLGATGSAEYCNFSFYDGGNDTAYGAIRINEEAKRDTRFAIDVPVYFDGDKIGFSISSTPFENGQKPFYFREETGGRTKLAINEKLLRSIRVDFNWAKGTGPRECEVIESHRGFLKAKWPPED